MPVGTRCLRRPSDFSASRPRQEATTRSSTSWATASSMRRHLPPCYRRHGTVLAHDVRLSGLYRLRSRLGTGRAGISRKLAAPNLRATRARRPGRHGEAATEGSARPADGTRGHRSRRPLPRDVGGLRPPRVRRSRTWSSRHASASSGSRQNPSGPAALHLPRRRTHPVPESWPALGSSIR